MKSPKKRPRNTPLPGKGRRLRRRLELLTGEAIMAMVVVIFGSFFLAGVARYLVGLPQTAAVISAMLVDLTNGDRAANNLGSLRVNPVLTAAAQAKANDMAAKGYFAHVSPEGQDPWYWFKQAGYTFIYAGENLAVDFSDSSDVERAWMNSPTHRENILDPHYTEIGIATAEGMYEGRQTIFVVQEFGTPTPQPTAATIQVQTIATSSVPEAPTTLATAEAPRASTKTASTGRAVTVRKDAGSQEQVLGSSAQVPTQAPPAQLMAVAESPNPAALNTFDVAAAAPLRYALSSPRDTLRWVYSVLALFLLAALAYTTRFEMKRHHIRHVGSVTGLVFLMGALFAYSSYYVFVSPRIVSEGAAAAQRL